MVANAKSMWKIIDWNGRLFKDVVLAAEVMPRRMRRKDGHEWMVGKDFTGDGHNTFRGTTFAPSD